MNNKISLQAQKENSILIWNDRVGKRERQSLGHEVKSMYNLEQEELLREYKTQFPTGYYRYDPTTGNIIIDPITKNPITYKYQPPNYNITLDAPNLQPELTQQEITDLNDYKTQYYNDITRLEQILNDHTIKIKDINTHLNDKTFTKNK